MNNFKVENIREYVPFILPVVVLYLVNTFSAPAPLCAAGPAVVEDPDPVLTPVKLEALPEYAVPLHEWVDNMHVKSFGDPPLYYPKAHVDQPVEVPDPMEVIPEDYSRPEFRLDGVMQSGKKLYALVNGKLLNTGAVIDNQWEIISIDVDDRTIKVRRLADKKEFTIKTSN